MTNRYIEFRTLCILVTAVFLLASIDSASARDRNLDVLDANPHIRTPITHGFWFPKLVTIGEEWYRGRLLEQGMHNETGELPDAGDLDGHLGFTATNAARWLITHHWFDGDDEIGEEQLYSRNPKWFFDPVDPANSVMGVFALFRWGLLNELEARLAIHTMINSYTDREYSILRDGAWLHAMADLSATDFTDNDGPRAVPNPLGLPVAEAIRYEIGVIMTHHFFGRNRNNTVQVMDKIYDKLVAILRDLNSGAITDEEARFDIVRLVRGR